MIIFIYIILAYFYFYFWFIYIYKNAKIDIKNIIGIILTIVGIYLLS